LEKPRNNCFLRVVAASICLTASGLEAQTIEGNAWTNTTSGNWEEPYWSLGVLPGPNQAVLLTNAGWKALAPSAPIYEMTSRISAIFEWGMAGINIFVRMGGISGFESGGAIRG
jgi:hypothetical protein